MFIKNNLEKHLEVENWQSYLKGIYNSGHNIFAKGVFCQTASLDHYSAAGVLQSFYFGKVVGRVKMLKVF